MHFWRANYYMLADWSLVEPATHKGLPCTLSNCAPLDWILTEAEFLEVVRSNDRTRQVSSLSVRCQCLRAQALLLALGRLWVPEPLDALELEVLLRGLCLLGRLL